MGTFTDALNSIGRFDPDLPISQIPSRPRDSQPAAESKPALVTSSSQVAPPSHKSKPALVNSSSQVAPPNHKSKPALVTSSSEDVPPSRKRKAEEELPAPTGKSLKLCKEGGPRAELGAGMAEYSKTPLPSLTSSLPPKSMAKVGSTQKDAQLGAKSENPIRPLTTASPPTDGKATRAAPVSRASYLDNTSLPPPKKNTYRELMSRKASDMVELPPKPEYTGKQIRDAAKRIQQQRKLSRAPRKTPTGPAGRSQSSEEKRIAEVRKQTALIRANRKHPRRAYNGTGAAQTQASSEPTTKPVTTTVPKTTVTKTTVPKTTAPFTTTAITTALIANAPITTAPVTTAPLVRTVSPETSSAEHSSGEMDVGYLDVQEEEARAALTARKEDEEEARLESELKKVKDARKKRIAESGKK